MTFIVCSKKPDEETASISFSGNQLAKFGFNAGCKVSVSITKGKIVITVLEDASSTRLDNTIYEGT
jgi:formylmethanofuran dehydrogenase subunit D